MSTASSSVSLLNNGQLEGNPALPDTSDRCMALLGLEQNPFSMAPDIVNFYSSPKAETVIVEVVQMVETRMGFALLYGDVGLGKTTISRRILYELDRRGISTSLVFNTFYQGEDLVAAINRDFGVRPAEPGLAGQMAALNSFLLEQRGAGRNCVIIVDDAQNLSLESLELVRQISNMETGIDKIVQVILIGQPELEAKLNEYSLRQLKSRIVLKRFFKPYSLRESTAYIRTKIRRAGDAVLLDISNGAIALVHEYSGGFPRRINVLMTRCLYAAVALGTTHISTRVVREAIRDMDEKPSRPGASAGNALVALIAGTLVMAVPVLGILLNPAAPTVPSAAVAESSVASPSVAVAESAVAPLVPAENPVVVQHSGDFDEHAGLAPARVELLAPLRSTDRNEAVAATAPPVTSDPVSAPDSPLADFLRGHGLAEFSGELAQALEDGVLESITVEIHRRHGYRLVSLPATVSVPAGFDALVVLGPAGDVESRLVLWRPTLWPETSFDTFYRQEQVMNLQRALSAAGTYRYLVDGIAGERTDTALLRFQELQGLDRSGIPDIQTLFLLERRALDATVDGADSIQFTGD